MERDTVLCGAINFTQTFQSTRSHGARRIYGSANIWRKKVSIHALAWSATQFLYNKIYLKKFQSTRSHGARPVLIFSQYSYFRVSIHALAWSATTINGHIRRSQRVSIHALAWSATHASLLMTSANTGFNPRARMERDRSNKFYTNKKKGFNPRARMERDRERITT